MKLDTGKEGLAAVYREYELTILEYLFGVDEGAGSGRVWRWVNEESDWALAGNTISRSSVIFFLNRLVDEGLLDWRDATGKGGHHRLYEMKMSRQEFVKAVIGKFVTKLREIKDQEGVEYDSPIFNISENE
ncbi:unnamed protein product, partial [marine sediment metagenome]